SFGATTVGSNLTSTAGGAVSQTGTLAVTGTSSINARAEENTPTIETSVYGGLVTATGTNISLTDANALSAAITASGSGALVAVTNLTVSGSTGPPPFPTRRSSDLSFGATTVGSNLTSTAGGAVSQTGTLAVTGTSSINA